MYQRDYTDIGHGDGRVVIFLTTLEGQFRAASLLEANELTHPGIFDDLDWNKDDHTPPYQVCGRVCYDSGEASIAPGGTRFNRTARSKAKFIAKQFNAVVSVFNYDGKVVDII